MIFTKIIFIVATGILLSIGLWTACCILLIKMYPKFSLQIQHHIFSLIVAVATFVLYFSFSSISTVISGIDQILDSVKKVLIEKSDIVDNITATLSSNADQQSVINETIESISSALNANDELNTYIIGVDIAKIESKNIANILNTEKLSVSEKSLQVIDELFESYTKEFTKTLKRLCRSLLIAMIILQLIYWGIMVYQAESKSRRNCTNESRLYARTSKVTKTHNRQSSDYHFRR